MAIIQNYKFITPDVKLIKDEYWDFILTPLTTNVEIEGSEDNNVISYINFGQKYYDNNNNCFISDKNYIWEEAKNENVTLNNFGITGVDNGSITYNKENISNKNFIELFFKSKKDITLSEKCFYLTPINGNNGIYQYDYSLNDDSISFNGGFLQGFFKLEGYNYQVLPDNIDKTLGFNLCLKLYKNSDENSNTLNNIHPNNKGMFFYIGTRAENKFYKYYNNKIQEGFDVDECLNYFVKGEYLIDTCGYLIKDSYISDVPLETQEGICFNEYSDEIISNNKFLTFHHGDGGFTTNNYIDEPIVIKKINKLQKDNDNKFLTFHHGEGGFTTNNIDEYNELNTIKYNTLNDILNNALGFLINEDGSISYRYLVKPTCNIQEEKKEYLILEEKTKENIIKYNEWSNIFIKLKPINNHKMKIFIYVNGYLIFISKELPLLNLKSLDDTFDKQETVPYNISVGGGTQGLCDVIYPDYKDTPDEELLLEKYFAGTFIGEIKSFKITNGNIKISQIKQL